MRFYAETPILGLEMGGKLEKVERMVAQHRRYWRLGEPMSEFNSDAMDEVWKGTRMLCETINNVKEGHTHSMQDNQQRKG